MGAVALSRRRVGAGWWVAGGCVVLAALSLLAPFALIYDAWSWAIWSRQLAHGTLDTMGMTAWKPLPSLVGLPVALVGLSPGAAWLLVERAAALGSLVIAWRLGERGAGRWAGVIAVVGVLGISGWLRYVAEGYSEPVVVTAVLGAALAALDRRIGWTLVALTVAALMRPEAWPLLALAGLWAWRDAPSLRWVVVAIGVGVVVLWFGGEWLGAGDPLAGSSRARAATTDEGGITTGILLPLVVLTIFGFAALGAITRDREVQLLAGGAVAWTVTVLVLQVTGWPHIERFQVPAAALWSVLGAIGLVRTVTGTLALSRGWGVALAVVVGAIGIASLVERGGEVGGDADRVAERIDLQHQLADAVERVGRDRLAAGAPCVNIAFQTALAWDLDVRATQVCAPHALPVEGCSTWSISADERRVTGPAPPIGPIADIRSGEWRLTRARAGECLNS
jgi:hypothetical protein